MTTEHEGLVARLLRKYPLTYKAYPAPNGGSLVNPDGPEAATAIQTLVEALELGRRLAAQVRNDLASAHAEICRLQGLDPATHSWPDWSPQANTLRWLTNEIEPTFDNALSKVRGEQVPA
jgi:hypothetical protein